MWTVTKSGIPDRSRTDIEESQSSNLNNSTSLQIIIEENNTTSITLLKELIEKIEKLIQNNKQNEITYKKILGLFLVLYELFFQL